MAITEMNYVFLDDAGETLYLGRQIFSMMFNQDGSVVMIRKLGTRESYEKYDTQEKFAEANPLRAAHIMKYLRERNHGITEIKFPEKKDIISTTKKCKMCGKTKPLLAFPPDDNMPDGTHNDCCECRITYCKREKATCFATSSSQSIDKFNECCICTIRKQEKGGMF